MKTAVEWYIDSIRDLEHKKLKDKISLEVYITTKTYLKEKAKEMEKEYIKKGWLQDRDITFGDWQQEFEQWYSQEFKQQEQ
jgi:hypothetical protein